MSGKNNYFKPTLKTELETKGYKDLILFQNNRGHFIYFAKNNKNEQIVLKVTDCEDYFSEDEYQLLSTLTHKNIIKVFNSFEVELEGTRWFVFEMEYANFGTLGSLLNNNFTFTENIIYQILFQICSAIEYLGMKKILHGDIKPWNIVITNLSSENFFVKLIDFEFARKLDNSFFRTGLFGTDGYMAPEILTGIGCNLQSDIFSLGATLYTLMSNDTIKNVGPYFGNNTIETTPVLINKIKENASKRNIQYSDKLIGTVMNMLERDESLRSTVQDILWEIREEDNNYENYDSGIVDNNNKSNLSDNFKNLLQENGYTVLEQIGRGNYGTVYKAVSQEREIALKVFVGNDFMQVDSGEREYDIYLQNNLNHSNIIKVFNKKKVNSNTLIIEMELLECDLEKLVKNKVALPEEMIIQILKQSCDVLQYLNSKKVCHCDIKLGNILIRKLDLEKKEIEIVFADFGSTKEICDTESISSISTLVCTSQYVAPEMEKGKPIYSHKTEMFALGVTLFKLMTFDNKIRIDQLLLSQEESKAKSVLMEQFLNGEIKYSSKLIDIVMKMLEKDPKNRFSAKQAMNALQNLKEHNNERKVLGTNV